jgi:hypothetical protein
MLQLNQKSTKIDQLIYAIFFSIFIIGRMFNESRDDDDELSTKGINAERNDFDHCRKSIRSMLIIVVNKEIFRLVTIYIFEYYQVGQVNCIFRFIFSSHTNKRMFK